MTLKIVLFFLIKTNMMETINGKKDMIIGSITFLPVNTGY